jgi:chromosome segregation ATPase
MSEENTKEFEQSKSFEDRVFLRFDAMDKRITSLELKEDRRQYETKPLWEHIVLTLDRLDEKVDAGFADINARFSSVNERLEKMDQRFERIDERFERINERFDGIDERFERIDERFDGIDERFERIDERFDGIDESIKSNNQTLQTVNGRLGAMEEKITSLATGVDQELPKVNRMLDVLNQWLLECRADHHDVESRLEKLESTSTKT